MIRRSSARFNRGRLGAANQYFNGNFASLWTPGTVLQSVQTDLGGTYGSTPRATGTGPPPVITLTGTLNAGLPFTGWTITCTLGGALGVWTGLVTYLRDGSTQAFTSAASVPLTGAGAGLTLGIAAGTANVDNVWKATCSAWADQSGQGKDYSQATAAFQPIIVAGLQGKPALQGNEIAERHMTSALALPAPGTTPHFGWVIFRTLAVPTNNASIIGDTAGSGHLLYCSTGVVSVTQYSGANANVNSSTAINQWGRAEAWYTNSTSDYFQFGVQSNTGQNAGNIAATNMCIMGLPTATGCMDCEVMACVHLNALPTPAQLAAASDAVRSFYGPTVLV